MGLGAYIHRMQQSSYNDHMMGTPLSGAHTTLINLDNIVLKFRSVPFRSGSVRNSDSIDSYGGHATKHLKIPGRAYSL